MLNLPAPRAQIGLLRQYVINPRKFLGINRFMPPDFTSQEFSQFVEWWIQGALVGKMGPYQMGTQASMIQSRSGTLKRQGTAFWRGSARIDEQDLLRIADIQDPNRRTLAGKKLILEKLNDINLLTSILMEWSVWQALNNGLTAYDSEGIAFQVDYGLPAKTQVDTAWATFASATPHADIQTELEAFAGTGVSKVDIVYNSYVRSLIAQNEVIQDRIAGSVYALETGTGAIGNLLKQLIQSNTPEPTQAQPIIGDIICYDEGYHTDESTFTRFLPNDTVWLIGSGGPEYKDENLADLGTIGRWTSTPAVKQTFEDVGPGPFVTMEDNTKMSPKHVAMEGGINGLPTIKRPTWVRRLKISAA